MSRFVLVLSSIAALCSLASVPSLQLAAADDASPNTARGIVFHDANGNRVKDAGEEPLKGIRVSNGLQIVTTGDDGGYELPVTDDMVLFVIKPRGWQVPLSADNLPQFFYVHKPEGSPESRYPGVAPTGPLPDSVNFPLTPHAEPEQFQAVLFGDTQPRNEQEVDYMTHDVIEELIGTQASFGVTLGDIVFDDLKIMQPLNRAIALLGIPWYNVIGNHDINSDARERQFINETFERVYGPSYYSFDYGPTHFIVLDNIDWLYDSGAGKYTYRGGLGQDQLEFVRTDLNQIPDDQMVVLLMHVPLTNTHDRHGLYRLIEERPFCISVSGHTHHHEHVWIDNKDGWKGPRPHHHIINVTVCGSWWTGAPDERGIPHSTMADGAPNGYSLLSFDGTNYRLDFRAAGKPADYQMEIDAPDSVQQANLSNHVVSVNVFNGSQKTIVEMRADSGEWQQMKQVRAIDPRLQRTWNREAAILEKSQDAWRPLTKPKPSTHLWQLPLPADLPTGTVGMEIRATDQHGQVFHGRRILRVTK